MYDYIKKLFIAMQVKNFIIEFMKEILNFQYKNIFLWLPFVMAFGAALYFSLETEPGFNFPIIITFLCGAIFFRYKNILIRAICVFLFGFFYAMSFAHIINTPQIKDSFGFINISGTVKDIDFTTDSVRVFLSVHGNDIDPNLENKNVNVRISLPKDSLPVHIGDTINGNAKLFHPSGKYIDGSFDFARWAYFANLSATGFFQDYKITESKNSKKHLRTYIHDKADSVLTDTLILGYKKMIPEKENQIWKTVGVGHVWSISGFHMTLIGGWFFAFFYLIFRCFTKLTRRMPAKYPALICSWVGLIGYLCISGISVATVRAFLMATLIGIATLLGRGVFSLRNGALAFLVIFLINPFFVMNAGFQLSFAAIFGLLWFFDDKVYIKRTGFKRLSYNLYLSLMTAVIATLFTLPFIIAHFGYIPTYSLLGNLIILPIFSVAIMPLLMIGTIFALFGNHYLISITNHIYNFALHIAQHIADLPHASLNMPFVPNSALILSTIGFLFLILIVKPEVKNFFIKHINYCLCGCCVILAITITATHSKPLFYSAEDNQLVGFVVDRKLKFNKARSSGHYFAFNSWREFNNEEKQDKNERYKCNHGLCVYKTDKWNLVYMQNFTTIMNNIENVCLDDSIDFIVSPFEIKSSKCHANFLRKSFVIYPNGKIKKIINQRPWHNLPQQNKDLMQGQ